jgi:hypothetical protein
MKSNKMPSLFAGKNFEYSLIFSDFRNESDDCDASFIYEEDQDLKFFACSNKVITAEILTSWYTARVHQIENRSCIIDHALTLIKLARERNIMVSPKMSIYSEQLEANMFKNGGLFLVFVILLFCIRSEWINIPSCL